MLTANQVLLALVVAIPFIGTIPILLLSKKPDLRDGASMVTAVLTFVCAALLLPSAFAPVSTSTPAAVLAPGLELQLTADSLGLLFATLASFLWIVTTVYSIGYMRGLREHAQTRYYASFALVIGATMGTALASNLFCLFLFYEILTVATYPLVVHAETPEAFAAGRKYLIYTLSGGIAVLLGLTLLQGMGGSVLFVAGGNPAVATIPMGFAQAAFLLLFAGFGVKASIVPLHGWLPSAMIAPTPVSGLLHAVAVVKSGVFGLLRVMLFLFGPFLMVELGLQNLVILAAAITIIVGSIIALRQDDFKLRLAYSTISQLSYIVLGAAILLPPGLTGLTDAGRAAAVIGACFAIAAHAFGKLTMFFVAGAVAVETGKTKISELDGIGRKMPWEFVAFTLATLSMAGLPPMAGFISKWYLSVGAWTSGDWAVLLVLIVSSVLNLAYFLPIVIRAFFKPYPGTLGEARPSLRFPTAVTAAGCLILGIWTALPYGPFQLAVQTAASVTHVAIPQVATAVFSGPFPPFLIFLIGGPLVFLLKGRARQAGLIVVAGLALLYTLLMPGGYFAGYVAGGLTSWNISFMGYTLTLLRIDQLSYLMGVIFALITFFAILYSVIVDKPWIQLFAVLYAGVSMGMVFAGDWISVLVFWELMAVISTLLIWQQKGEALGAGYRYLLFHGLGGAFLAAGVALLFMSGMSPVVGPIPVMPFGTVLAWASAFILVGIGVNICFIPLHTWLPDSYPKAHFVASVFLSVYTTKAAVYLLARVQPGAEWIAFMGALMAVYGVVFAVFQNDMRKLLSYHIVSQVGYMVAGIGIFCWLGASSEIGLLGLNGGMAHVFNHILYKALLFMAVGVIIWRTGENLLSRVGGLGKKMPVTAIAFWIAAFSISGLPLFNGFVSKGMISLAAEEVSPLIFVLLGIASFGTFLSFLKLGYFAFLRPGNTEASDPPLLVQLAMIGPAILCVAIGVYPQLLYPLLPVPVAYNAYTVQHLVEVVVIAGLAALFFFTIGKKLLEPHETNIRDIDTVYVASGHGVVAFAGGMADTFGSVYAGARGAAAGIYRVGKKVQWTEGRDTNWNLVAFAGTLIAGFIILFLGVG